LPTITVIKSLLNQAFFAICIAILFIPGSASADNDTPEYSQAETLLWLTDQLKAVSGPTTFTYKFQRTGTLGANFSDTVRFAVTGVKTDGMKSAQLEFFSGDRRIEVSAPDSTNINPVLKIYLQGDVYEMNRLTDPGGGSKERWRYFQRQIKHALADAASVETVTIEFSGQDYSAWKVQLSPFQGDAKLSNPSIRDESTRRLYDGLVGKTYTVIISEDLPGYLYRIETVTPNRSEDSDPLIREVLQLVDVGATSVAADSP
jgi:hypothetical protein